MDAMVWVLTVAITAQGAKGGVDAPGGRAWVLYVTTQLARMLSGS